MAWTGFERLGTQAIQFIVGIVIARVLMPSDFGIIGMLTIFIAIAQTFLDSGFANALIQKKDRTEVDYSTVFYFNIAISLVLYGLFYVSAPFIASFYNMPQLKSVARVISLSLIINGLSIVQTARLSIELNFKLQSLGSLVSIIISGVVGIAMAYAGFGAWALVFQTLTLAASRTLILWLFSHWRPLWAFSVVSFRKLFSFGSKLLCTGMINTIYQNLYTLVIGKAFNAAEVGFFNRGELFARLPADTMTQTVVKVNFPILSEYQNDDVKLIHAYRKLLRMPMYVLYFIFACIIGAASPMIEVVLGEKWLPCVPVLQILCLGYMWSPLTHINLNLLYVKGRSDLVLKLELIKKPIAFAILFASIPFGIGWMCAGRALYFFVAFVLNCYYTRKILNYGFLPQLRELLPVIVNAALMVGVITLAMLPCHTVWTKLLAGLLAGIASYLIFSLLTQDESMRDLKDIVMNKTKRENGQL
ncbi:MAG: lipopolysaccharide biosynthesis protein [Prevotellaceae bacterium]|nr:lipopolysaccharide biosynthesis protein [Prevotellaceae bacterium]